MPIGHMVLKIYVPCKNFHMPRQYLYKPCQVYAYWWENKNIFRLQNHLPSQVGIHKSLHALGQDLHAPGNRACLNVETCLQLWLLYLTETEWHMYASETNHHWSRQWLITWSAVSASSHYLNQCWNIINWTLRNKLQGNFNRNSCIFIQENAFENVVWKIAAILSQSQCVNGLLVA